MAGARPEYRERTGKDEKIGAPGVSPAAALGASAATGIGANAATKAVVEIAKRSCTKHRCHRIPDVRILTGGAAQLLNRLRKQPRFEPVPLSGIGVAVVYLTNAINTVLTPRQAKPRFYV
jgi:hypothetical protein